MVNEEETEAQDLILTMPVLVPGEKDCDYNRGEEPLSAEKIEQLAHSFMKYQIIDRDHDYIQTFKKVGELLESFILDKEEEIATINGESKVYPVGTWIIKVNVYDDDLKQSIENGEYTGASVSVFSQEVCDRIYEQTQTGAFKESSSDLICDIENPACLTVSIVRKPCVKSAKFCKRSFKMKMEDVIDYLKSYKSNDPSNDDGNNKKNEPDFVTAEKLDEVIAELKESVPTMVEEAVKECMKKPAGNSKKSGEGAGEASSEGNESETTPNEPKKQKNEEEKEEGETNKTSEPAEPPKSKSKQSKVHNNEPKKAVKSDSMTVYEIMGRSSNGSTKR